MSTAPPQATRHGCGCVTTKDEKGVVFFLKKCKIGKADPGHLSWIGVRAATTKEGAT